MPTMKDLAALLGVELGEEFEVEKVEDGQRLGVYTITNEEIKVSASGGNWWSAQLCGVVEKICTGRYRIIKKPLKPEMGMHYWFVGIDGDPVEMCWMGNMQDHALYATGNCFRTENDAFDHREEVIACMKSIYKNGREEQKSEKPSVEEAMKTLKQYCEECACDQCEFCVDKENGEGCRLKDIPAIWPI